MAFDQDKPAANTSLRVSNPEILDNQEALQDAINREHIFSGTSAGTQTGDHTQGSARAFSQAEPPANRIDGDGFLSTDLGSIWIDTDDNSIYMLTATLPTWTPISTELYESFLADPRVFLDTLGVDGDFEVGTGSEFTVEAATGNVATDGTLDVAGAGEVVGIATLGDGSTLKTAAAPTADAEIANKKYVDEITQSTQVVGTTDITNSTGGFIDMTNMSITITTNGGNVLLMFSAQINAGGNFNTEIRFDADGSPLHLVRFNGATDSNDGPVAFQYLIIAETAASHTYKVQWKDVSGTAQQLGTDTPRVFTVIDLPN